MLFADLQSLSKLFLALVSGSIVSCGMQAGLAGELTTSTIAPLRAENGRKSPCWHGDTFQGQATRTLSADGEQLIVDLDVQQGGFDTAISKWYGPIRVDELPSDLTVTSTIDMDVELIGKSAKWWVGPKFSIAPIEEGKSGLREGAFECYVIENASMSYPALDTRLRSWIDKRGGEYLGTSELSGATYHHYRLNHRDWKQMWAVRERYRDSGALNVVPIVSYWRDNGLPNEAISAVRVNVETAGALCGTATIRDVDIPQRVDPVPR